MKKLILALMMSILGMGIVHANTGPTASQVQTNCTSWSKNLNCTMTNQQLVDNAVDQLTGTGGSYTFSDSLINNGGSVSLVNDVTAPGTSMYYGTNSGGTLGWYGLGSGTGSVTSVALTGDGTIFNSTVSGSPITTSGTLTPALLAQSRNTVLAGPTTGGGANPTFRNLTGADLPNPTGTTLGGVQSITSASHQWINSISTSGVPSLTQPSYTDISGSIPAITALTGDATAAGIGSQPITFATVNSNVGSFTNANITVNAKGLITAAANGTAGSVGSGTTGQEAIYNSSSSITSGNITDIGNIGIGSTLPGVKFDVQGTSRFTNIGRALDIEGTLSSSYFAGNVGIGSTNPSTVLDVQGTIRSTNVGTALDIEGTLSYANFAGNISTGVWKNPIVSYNAAGIVTTTTGSISSSSNTTTLTVGSASGWAVGEGININGAGTAGADLITKVIAISGTTFTVANAAITTVSGATILHDDTVALTNALNSGYNVDLGFGQYNVSSVLAQTCSTNSALTNSVFIQGAGNVDNLTYSNPHQGVTGGAVIWNTEKTNNIITLCNSYTQLRNFAIEQNASVTPTAGYAVSVNSVTLTIYDVRLDNLLIKGVYNGISLSGSITTTQINNCRTYARNIAISQAQTSSYGIQVNNSSFNPVTGGVGTGISVTGSDESAFIGDSATGWLNDFVINDSTANVAGLRIIGGSFENSTNTGANGAITISSTGHHTVHDITIVGNEFAQNAGSGVRINNYGTNITIQGNTFDGGAGGVGVADYSSDGQVSVIGNNFENNAIAITVGTASNISSMFMAGNTFYNNTTNIANSTGYTTGITTLESNISGNLGVGTWIPNAQLDIEGTVTPSVFYAASNATNINVGIGSFTPGAKLDVQGTVRLNGLISNSTACTTAARGQDTCWGTGSTGACLGYCTVGTFPACSTCTCC